MISKIEKYKNKGHFFFEKGFNLSEESITVPNLPGIYVIQRLARGKIDLVYIGKSGQIKQNGKFKDPLLRNHFSNKQDGIKLQKFFEEKIDNENIDALDIYWYVTFDQDHHDIPSFVEAELLQWHLDMYGVLPKWNKSF